jgi:tetratricopeptide (TPR) repeat protein
MSALTKGPKRRLLIAAGIAAALGLGAALGVVSRKATAFVKRATLGDLEVIHSHVLVGAQAQQGTSRLAAGDHIATQAAGRAKLRLADGVTALLDGASEVVLASGRIELLHGRLFIDSPEGRRIEVATGHLQAPVSASKVAFERTLDGSLTKIFCAQGEVLVSAEAAVTRVPSGETLTASAGKTLVAPEQAFDDWTGGLAVPWAAKPLARSALADVWATTEQGDPLTPLHVSAEVVQVALTGEFATTRSKTRYYNGNDGTVTPTVRLALPQNAILTKVAHRLSTQPQSFDASIEICQQELTSEPTSARLEWAGNGWIAGALPQVPAGGSIDLELEYGQWLTAQSGRMTYRYPMGQKDEPPLIGELSIEIDAAGCGAPTVEANSGAIIEGKKLVWRAADAKPSDDWVVSYSPTLLRPKVARAYVESSKDGGDPYVMLRAETEARATQGVQLAIIVDSSRSVGLSGLELSRQIVDALLGNLSERDTVIAFAADEEPKAVGPAVPSPNTKALRERILSELSQIRPGGASHLAKALERAADAIDSVDGEESSRIVVYLGDGRPSLGELTADRIRAQLQRRSHGIPRIAGIAVGPNADRWLLARLVAGSGPVFTVLDRSEAAKVAASVVSAAEESTHRDVKFDLGPAVDRIYPREGRAVASGSTAVVVGRLRGPLPETVQLSRRDGASIETETLRVEAQSSPSEGEVARRWALARIDEIVAGSEGIAPALNLAQQQRLLLPWTEWVLDPSQQRTRASCSKFSRRIVELSTLNDTPFARRIEEPSPNGSGWLEPPLRFDPGQSLEQGAAASGQVKIAAAKASIAACRDARLHSVPNLPEGFDYHVALSGNGRVERVTVTPAGNGSSDSVLFGCIERVIRNLSFVGADRPITFEGTMALPPPRDPKRTQCSVTAALPLALRRIIWSTRSGDALARYENALRSCETTTWADRRELLLELTGHAPSVTNLLEFALSLSDRGHSDAADFVRSEALRRTSTLDELKELRHLILAGEPNLDADLAAKLRHATTDPERLALVTRALGMAPHSPLGRRLQLLLLERLGDKAATLREVQAVRGDPFTDAGLIALAAAALRRQGHEAEAQRTFSELFERSPNDPWVLAFAGDQLRAEGFAEQALAAYESLGRVVPNDTATLLRTGLAQASVGRVDIATRLLDRAAQTAGRSDDQRLNELGAVVRAIVLGRALAASTAPPEKLELARRLAQTALPDVAAIVLVEAPASPEQGFSVKGYRGDDKTPLAPDLDAAPLGLAALLVDRGPKDMSIEVTRRLLAGLGRSLPVTVSVLFLGADPSERQLRTRTLDIAVDAEKALVTLSAELRP